MRVRVEKSHTQTQGTHGNQDVERRPTAAQLHQLQQHVEAANAAVGPAIHRILVRGV